MVQIRLNTPKKIPVSSTNIATLYNSTITETLANSINTEILVNSINPYPSKYPVNLKTYT